MSCQLGDFVIEGFLRNCDRHSTHGMLLRGYESPLSLQLTGDAGPALHGRAFEFRPRNVDAGGEPTRGGLALMQVGPTGTITYKMVKVLRNDIADVMAKREKPEFDWKPCLYIEWFGQNGRVVVEMVDPVIDVTEGDPLPELEISSDEPVDGMEFTIMKMDAEGHPEVQSYSVTETGEENEEEFPDDIDAYLEKLNDETENAYRCREEQIITEMENGLRMMMEEDGEFIGSLLEPKRLPPVYDVDEERARELVMSLLAELALRGIAVHLCKHCTMRQAYAYLIEEIIQKERVPPGLNATGWVRGFDYGESCPECEAEFEERYRREHPPAEE